jgi:hypothetical protein
MPAQAQVLVDQAAVRAQALAGVPAIVPVVAPEMAEATVQEAAKAQVPPAAAVRARADGI